MDWRIPEGSSYLLHDHLNLFGATCIMRIFLKHKIKVHLAACALAGAAFSGSALGAIVYSGPVNIPIPDTTDGLYFNVVTGVSGGLGSGVPGWDINPYSATVGTAFNLWGPTTNTWFNPQAIVTGNYNLPPGTVIEGAAAAFFRPGGANNLASQFTLNSDQNFLGFRFVNESASNQIQHGWVQVEFGATVGTRAIVAYAYEDTGAPIAAGDAGTPPPEAILGFDVASLGFGNVEVGTDSAPQTVTLSNTGTDSGDIATLGIDTAAFAISGGTCGAAPFTLDAGEDCTVIVTFSPTATGPASGELSFTAPLLRGGPIAAVALSGVGDEPAGAPEIGFDVSSLDFGTVDVGSNSAGQTATLTNNGDGLGTVTSVDIDNAEFYVSGGTCGAAPFDLDPGDSCTVIVSYSPTLVGPAEGELTFSTALARGGATITSVALNGTGVEPASPEIGFTTSSLTFGNVAVGATSAPQTVTIANTGTAPGTVPALGTDTADFAISGGTCGAAPFTLAAGASCTVAVTFSPTTAGPLSGELSFDAGGVGVRGGPILAVALVGVGVAGGPAPVVANVPVNSPWALIALLGMFGLIASVSLRRR